MSKKLKPPMIKKPSPKESPYGGHDYRVRVIEVKMVVDIYDAKGNLIGRTRTDPEFPITEKDFPEDLCRLIKERTDMKNGFYCLRPEAKD